MPPKKKEIDLKNLDLTHIYTPEEIEHINNHLKTRINFENGRLLPIPQSPIANEAVVHEISRQLGNWNVETGQNGIVTTSQGGYNFSVKGQSKIRAPHIAFIPENIYNSLSKTQLLTFFGQPFTPIFVTEVVNVSKEAILNEVDIRFKNDYFATGTSVKLGWLIDPRNHMIWTYEKDDDENVTRQKRKWEDLDGGNILPGFTLDIEFVEKIISQKYDEDELLIEEVKENEDKESEHQTSEKDLVLEYADGGILRNYLKNNFTKLTLGDKWNLTYQLACGVSCLHNEVIYTKI
uniref:Putative restriction endonuclease domain-containing protein n=1 Tax=Rhizophagus irregularis (strain DAOM 181602 / DAOM 197198 / MUCL 43194) TaxID=747089 RepID=U9U1R3_RHIID